MKLTEKKQNAFLALRIVEIIGEDELINWILKLFIL